jgi:hypothetical protein
MVPVFGDANTALKWSGGGTSTNDGLSLGSFVDLGSGAWSLQTGLFYNRYGGQASNDYFSYKILLDYISVPLFAKFNVLGHVDNTPYVKVGMTPGLLTGSSLTFDNTQSFAVSGDLRGFRKYDIPASVGVGASIYSDGRNALVIEASYFRSLTSINNLVSDMRNEGFLFNLGVSIAL